MAMWELDEGELPPLAPPKPPLPGPTALVAGDTTNGFYGEVPASELFTATELAQLVGATPYGAVINNTTPWLKCVLDGKVLYTPKLPIRNFMTWNQIESLKIRTAAQDKQVTKGDYKYRVRLMTATGPGWAGATGEDPAGCEGSEYNRLIYRLCALTPPREQGPAFASYSLAELGLTLGPGCCVICQEAPAGYMQRNGGNGTNAPNSWNSLQTTVDKNLSDQYRGWRPILEVVTE